MSQEDQIAADPIIARANDVIDRLFALDETVTNAWAFRALLEDLHARDLSSVREPHVTAITMVQAGIVRGAIGTVMACLETEDWRGNRASVGQILGLLRDERLVAVFPELGKSPDLGTAALDRANHDYTALLANDLLARGRRIRNEMVAHTLIPDDPTPTVTYDTIYALHDAAARLVSDLYRVCYRGTPGFIEQTTMLIEHARIFWDTYVAGIRSM